MIKCSGSSIFWSLLPNSTALSEKVPLSLSMYLIPIDNHISVYRTKILWAVAKLAHFFTLSVFQITPFQPLHFIGAGCDYIDITLHSLQHNLSVLFMNQIVLKMPINKQISVKLYSKFEYECIRMWLSNALATDTWKVGHGKHSYFLINAHIMDGGAGRGVAEKTEGCP